MKPLRPILTSILFIATCGVKAVRAQPITAASDGTGTIVISPDGRVFNITGGTQAGANLFHSFEQFGLNQGQTADFQANPSIQNILGRVVGGNASAIDGLIKVTQTNANFYLVNPTGIFFGSNARLDVPGSFTATTANGIRVGDSWFKAIGSNNYGNLIGTPNGFAFNSNQPGAILNAGNLSVPQGENITLLGGQVINTGRLSTEGGKITVAAVSGENLVEITPEGGVLSLGLPTEVQANLKADAQPISPLSLPQLLTGGNLSHATGVVVENGVVKLTGSGTVISDESGTAIASGTIDTSNTVAGETGGKVNVLGDKVGVISANIDVSGTNGGGTALIGGDYKGQGAVPNASRTFVSRDSVIKADALINGNGGRVIAWADGTTGFYGNISARGGAESGDGGFVEVSGKENLIFRGDVDVSAVNGSFGKLLLDPINITIVNGNGAPNDSELDDSKILQGESPEQDFTISEEKLEGLSGDVELAASNNITLEDLQDNVLNFQSADSIKFTAGGNFSMNPNDTIFASGKVVSIEAASIVAGDINTADIDSPLSGNQPGDFATGGEVNLIATNGNITAGRISATTNINLQADRQDPLITIISNSSNAIFGNPIIAIDDLADITVKGIEIIFPNDLNVSNLGLTVNTSGIFRVTDTLQRKITGTVNNTEDFTGSILLIDGAPSGSFVFGGQPSQQPRIAITHGGRRVTLSDGLEINGGNQDFGFVAETEPIPVGISGTVGSIISFVRPAGPDTGGMAMYTPSSRIATGGEIGNPEGNNTTANVSNSNTQRLQQDDSVCSPFDNGLTNKPFEENNEFQPKMPEKINETAEVSQAQGFGICQTINEESEPILQVEGFDVPSQSEEPTTKIEYFPTPNLGFSMPNSKEKF